MPRDPPGVRRLFSEMLWPPLRNRFSKFHPHARKANHLSASLCVVHALREDKHSNALARYAFTAFTKGTPWRKVPPVEFDRAATLHVRRAKNGKPAAHPIRGDELRALRELQRQTSGGYVFETERGTPFTTDAVNRLIKRIGERAGFPFKVHVHMLRHACGYALANAGHDTRAIQDWLGHRAIQHTARYTELSQERFKDFWRA